MGPLLAAEGRVLDNYKTLIELGVLVGWQIGWVPGLELSKHTQAEEARLFVFGEVHPHGGIVVGLVCELDRVDIVWRKVQSRIELEFERNRARGGIDVVLNLEEERRGVFGLETQGAVFQHDRGLAQAFDGTGLVLVAGRKIDGLVALGEVCVGAFVEGGAEGERLLGVGCQQQQERKDHGFAFLL